MEATEILNQTILAHVPYGVGLVPSNFHLFLKMKEELQGHVCVSIEEVERAVRTWMKKKVWSSFMTAFRNFSFSRRKCVENNVDYSFIPLACTECDDSLPFPGASSIPLHYVSR
jgi:hypothetical protein